MIKNIKAAAVLAVMTAVTLCGCGSTEQTVNTASAQNIISTAREEENTSENTKTDSGYFAEFPEEITEIPKEYFSSAKEQGTLE